MNIYYTPELWEFRDGFRFETNVSEDSWLKITLNYKTMLSWAKTNSIYLGLQYGHFRVKALDRYDIEELGWKYVEDDVFILTSEGGSSSRFGSTPYLEIMENGTILITRGFSSYMGIPQGIVFKGYLKNYNELEFIMKRIGIIE